MLFHQRMVWVSKINKLSNPFLQTTLRVLCNLGYVVLTSGFIALNDVLIEDTDKPTNPWLDLILESNKNEKEPTKLWNLVQNEIARGTPLRLDDQRALNYVLHIFVDQHELAFRILRDISASDYTATINLGNIEFFDVNFQNAKFNLPVDFSRSHFEKAVTFDDASFYEEADFTHCIFAKAVSFDRTRFGKFATFTNAKFAISLKQNDNDQKFLFNVKFEANANFENSEFGGPLEFRFDGKPHERKIAARVWFNGAVFCKDVAFQDIEFKFVEFTNAVFEENAYFQAIRFRGYTNFEKVNFMKWVWFGSKQQDFTNVYFDDKVSLVTLPANAKRYLLMFNSKKTAVSKMLSLAQYRFTIVIFYQSLVSRMLRLKIN